MTTLPEGPVQEVAKRLLGARLRTEFAGLATEVILTEVEAYGGVDDPASHASRGVNARNRAMFGPAGTLYVYRSYGVHWCANVVTGAVGMGEAVLLRAGLPTEGEETMRRRRGRRDHLCDGPGKLCQALGITGSQDGTSLFEGPVRLRLPAVPPPQTVLATSRVGISREKERPWRFTVIEFS
ncbi:MAG: DNA-3-methyladenine glycosylase [Gammaproteobacteria bacterium]|nr:DNA-3-methyladenine glycosylase [Gammaproteobacteria bacterium]